MYVAFKYYGVVVQVLVETISASLFSFVQRPDPGVQNKTN